MARKTTATKAKADDKTAKKTVSLAAKDLRTKSPDELQQLIQIAQHDLLEFQKLHAANELANPQVLKSARRDVARIKTILTEVINAHREEEN
jgi:ribosomal protein L29